MLNKNDKFFLIYKDSLTLRQKLIIKKNTKKITKNNCNTFSIPFKIDFTPAIFKSNAKNKILMYAFKSEKDIPLHFYKKYSAAELDVEMIITELNAIEMFLKKEVELIINPFCENPIRLTLEDLKGIENG